MIDDVKIEELLIRGVANIIPGKEELKKLLTSGKKLNIYFGIDPTVTEIHLGHAFPVRKLQKLAEFEHNVTFLIGDFTALVGDTSDKDSERPSLTEEQIHNNFQTYKEQAKKFLDFSKIKVRFNSEWLSKLSLRDAIKLAQHFSFGDFASRELIKKRLESGKRVGLHEALYPLMQGYDSYYMNTDIQLGGTDQTFNMQAGRTLIKDLRGKESYIITNEFLMGTDGRKMSKTWGNAIWINDSPNDIYGKVMSIKDDLIIEYFTLGTNVSMDEIKKIEEELKSGKNPMEVKKRLAFEIVKELNDEQKAKDAEDYFEKTVQKQETPADIPVYLYKGQNEVNLVNLLVDAQLTTSKSDAKRLIEQGAVEVDNEKINDINKHISPKDEMMLKIGKRKFVRIKIEEKPQQ